MCNFNFLSTKCRLKNYSKIPVQYAKKIINESWNPLVVHKRRTEGCGWKSRMSFTEKQWKVLP